GRARAAQPTSRVEGRRAWRAGFWRCGQTWSAIAEARADLPGRRRERERRVDLGESVAHLLPPLGKRPIATGREAERLLVHAHAGEVAARCLQRVLVPLPLRAHLLSVEARVGTGLHKGIDAAAHQVGG